MKKKKVITYSAIAMATVGSAALLGLAGIHGVSAQTGQEERRGPIQAIIDKFDLDPGEVDAVLEANRNEYQEQHLTQAVEDGDITEDQKQLIEEKRAEMEAQREEFRNLELTEDERKAMRDEHRSELESWAEENGIPQEFMMGGRGQGFGENQGMHRPMNANGGFGYGK